MVKGIKKWFAIVITLNHICMFGKYVHPNKPTITILLWQKSFIFNVETQKIKLQFFYNYFKIFFGIMLCMYVYHSRLMSRFQKCKWITNLITSSAVNCPHLLAFFISGWRLSLISWDGEFSLIRCGLRSVLTWDWRSLLTWDWRWSLFCLEWKDVWPSLSCPLNWPW